MIDMLKRHEVQVLRRAGHGLKEVAKLAGVSQSSVQRIEGEAPVVALDVAAERTRRGVGRPSNGRPRFRCDSGNKKGSSGNCGE
jgi:hypothetical protein